MDFYKGKPNRYNVYGFIEIPAGDHRVQISKVRKETSNKTGTICYEITLKVSGSHGKLWYYLWDNPEYPKWKVRDFSAFANSFQIPEQELENHKYWVGKSGAVRVVHNGKTEDDVCSCQYEAKVVCCLSGKERDCLPAWREAADDVTKTSSETDSTIIF